LDYAVLQEWRCTLLREEYVVVAVVKGVPDPITVKDVVEEHLLEVTLKAVEAVGKVD
jgi:hypothetical protein